MGSSSPTRDENKTYLKPPPTPPKFNMEPENDGFQKESPFPGVDFQVQNVKLAGCRFYSEVLVDHPTKPFAASQQIPNTQ